MVHHHWHCNYYGYSYGPNYQSWEGYFYYLYRYWLGQSVRNPNYYEAPDDSASAGNPRTSVQRQLPVPLPVQVLGLLFPVLLLQRRLRAT